MGALPPPTPPPGGPLSIPPQGTEPPPAGRTSPQDGRSPPCAALSSSSSISSLSSSTVRRAPTPFGRGSVGTPSAPYPLPDPPFSPPPQPSGSLLSLYSDSELRRVAVRGCVQFSLRYEAAAQELRVHVVRCRQLAEAKRQRSDP